MNSPPLSSPNSRLENLDVFRGLAASAVCVFHFGADGALPWKAASRLAAHGYLGFDVFFVISGFVIPLALHKARYAMADYGTFLLRRFFRLYPAFLASGVLALALWYASCLHPDFRGAQPRVTAAELAGNLTLSADIFRTVWIIPVYWTLAIEAQYYILIGLTFSIAANGTGWSRRAFVATWLIAPLLLPWHAAVFEYAALFGMGILAFMRVRGLIGYGECAVGIAAAVLIQGFHADWSSAAAGLLTVLAISFLPPITARPLVFLGTISYSLYLIHVPFGGKIVHFAQRLPASPALRYGTLPIAVAATLAASYAFYRAIERPSHEFSRSLRFSGR